MIPINLVTGFLGVGKTTVIKHLLAHRPDDQKWAVLVNEFGDMGIDGVLLDSEGVAIEEVAGGCLCCVAAPAFTVGLNRLIRQHRPDRILIEPSGLGHPAQVLETLRSVIYQDVLDVQATLCVMDARHLASARHREHPNFVDQIHLCDVLIANKADQYSEQDEQAFWGFCITLKPRKSQTFMTEHGQVDGTCLSLDSETRAASFPEAHAFLLQQDSEEKADTPSPRQIIQGQADGYFRAGWLFDKQYTFNKISLTETLNSLNIERVKGVFRCKNGGLSYNRSSDNAEIKNINQPKESRLQLIDSKEIETSKIDASINHSIVINVSGDKG